VAKLKENTMARAKRDIPKITLKTPKLPKEPVAPNMSPTVEEMLSGTSPFSRTEISRVGALGGTPNSSEELTGINISQREGDRIQRSEYKMPKKKQIKPKPRPDVGAIERGNRAAKRTAQDLATQNFEEGGRIADVRDNPKRGITY
tara:strand:+ start:578 stop:1015 length:438 start_codon:yes stop_codon:yes gene_type:complete